MDLSGQQRKQLQSALIDAFPTLASLEQMLAFELDKSLRAIAGEGSLQDIVFKLIQIAEAEGWVEDLVRAARRSNSGNSLLEAITRELLNPNIPILFPDNLSSDVGVDYTRLRDLLVTGNWKEADYETINVMLQATAREVSYEFINSLPLGMYIKFFPYPGFIENFPCTDLRTIDQLWVKYSNGRFGFSVQKRIWENVGYYYNKFGDRVGWTKGWWMNKRWIWSDEVTYDTSAPVGHLPWRLSWVMEFSFVAEISGCTFPAPLAWKRAYELGVRFAVFSRIQACNKYYRLSI